MTTARIFILADNADANAKMAETAAVAEKTGQRIGDAGTAGASRFGTAFEKSTGKVSGLFSKLSSTAASYGLPFAATFDKMGQRIDAAEGKGKRFAATLGEIGKVSLGAGVTGLAAIAGESVHLADQFDTAQASLKTAVTNSGNSWSAFAPQAKTAYDSMAKLGFENTQVAKSLQILTTATNNPTKALSDMNLVANIARLRHIGLSDAASSVAKILGGNTRVIAQWGLNLDIGSGKLHAIQSAEFSLRSAQAGLAKIQAEVNDGQLTGVAASSGLYSAHLALTRASLNLQQSQQAIPRILDALNQRTKGTADAFGKTLPGQIQIARAQLHNLGVDFGEYLVPKIIQVEHAIADVIHWFQRNEGAAKLLGYAIGTALGGTIAVFAGQKVLSFVRGLASMMQSTEQLALTILNKAGIINTAQASVVATGDTMATRTTISDARIEAANARLASMWGENASEIGATDSTIAATQDTLAADIAAADAGIEAANAAAAASFTLMAASAAAAIPIVGALIYLGAKGVGLGPKPPPGSTFVGWSGGDPVYERTIPNGHSFVTDHGHGHGIDFVNPVTDSAAAKDGLSPARNYSASQYQKIVAHNLEQQANAQAQMWLKDHPIPGIPNIPGPGNIGGGGSTSNPLQNSGLSLLQSLQGAIASGSVLALRKATTDAMNQKLQLMVSELKATHQAGLVALADQLTAAHREALAELNAVLEIKYQTALADQTALMATELTDLTRLMGDMSASAVQAIQDASQIAQDRATAKSQHLSDLAQTQADVLGERGLYGLNLVAQQMKVGLDRITTRYDTVLAKDQQKLDKATQAGNAAIAKSQQHLDAVTKATDAAIQKAQGRVDQAATGSQLAQQEAAAALKSAQAKGALAVAEANAALQRAKDSSGHAIAEANRVLAQAQGNAKVAEAQQQALIAIEEAKAASQYAGSGVHITINGINPTDAAAVGSAVGWRVRTKVAAK